MPLPETPGSSQTDDANDFVLESLRGGTVFAGRYRIVRLLERTRTHAALLVKHLVTHDTLRLKALWPHLAGSATAMERFELEARLPALIRSEHVLTVLDAGVDPTTQIPFLVMERLAGQTAREAVEQQGPYAPSAGLDILKQLTLALGRAHSQSGTADGAAALVHGALNPDNVFICARDNGGVLAKIQNFGAFDGVSSCGDPVFAQRFIAPEQVRGEMPSPASDIWALGLLTLYMLTGARYWQADGASDAPPLEALRDEILSGPLPAPSERVEGPAASAWTRPLDDWFASCVNRDPTQRFPSVYQAFSTLESCLAVGSRATSTLSVDTTLQSAQPPEAGAPITRKERSMKFSSQVATSLGANRTMRSAEPPSPDTPISQVQRGNTSAPEPALHGERVADEEPKPGPGLLGWVGRVWRGGRAPEQS